MEIPCSMENCMDNNSIQNNYNSTYKHESRFGVFNQFGTISSYHRKVASMT